MLTSSDPSKPKKSFFSEWLEKLQQESWQLELLISGLALFGIWESRSLLLKLDYYLESNTVDPYDIYSSLFVNILWAGWAIFMVNLLIHIIIRGLWIGAIGLRYVSGDIDFDELNYSEIFKNYYKKRIGSFDDYIERLEMLSSVLFSFTFLLFFMLFSFVFINIVFATIGSTINNIFYHDSTGPQIGTVVTVSLLYGLGILVLIDFFTLGGFRKVKDRTFSKAYFWLYRFYSTISLSFIYRPLLLNFIDNRYTRNLFFLAIPYVLVLLFGFRLSSFERYAFIPSMEGGERYPALVDKYSINWNNYDDLRLQHHMTYSDRENPLYKSSINTASLTKYEYESSTGAIFLKYLKSDTKLLTRQNPDFEVFKKAGYRHSIFSKGKVPDSEIERLISTETRETRAMIKVVRDQIDQLDSIELSLVTENIDMYKQKTPDDIADLREDIEKKYFDLRFDYTESKLNSAREAILKNYDLEIDGIPYKDSLNCYFYTHPNRHEQGLLCHFSLDHLTSGSHMIHLKKFRNRGECVDNCPYFEKYIPFRKL